MATKLQHLRKVYTYANGETGRSAKPNWVTLTFELLGPKGKDDEAAPVVDKVVINHEDISQEIAACAVGHGMSQKIGDDQSGIAKKAKEDGVAYDKKRGYADYIKERIEAMLENFKAGVWVAEGESASGAGSVTILFEALCNVFANAGQELTDEQQVAVRGKLKDEEYRDSVKGRADVKAEIEKIKAARAAERAAKAAKAAEASEESDLGALLDG